MGCCDANVRSALNKESFLKADLATFNKEGFLVLQDPEWSDFELFQAPKANSQGGNDIVLSIGITGPMGMPYSTNKLDKPVQPTKIETKKGKVADGAYIFVPVTPLESGYYVIDFKKNGQGTLGYNSFFLQ